jgi:hypothetical protein
MQVQRVSVVMQEIATASEQQTEGVQQITTAVEQMNQVTQQNAANSEESASAAQELSGQATMLRDLVATFHLTPCDGTVSMVHRRPPDDVLPRSMSLQKSLASNRADAEVAFGNEEVLQDF